MSGHLDQIRDQQKETWDRFSAGWKTWDELVLRWLSPFATAMIRHAAIEDGDRVLDVAAGTGEPGLTVATAIPNGHVTVTDLSDRMLEAAADNARRRGITNFETKACDAGALPFDDATFDAVLCRFGFMFFPDVATAARQLTRVAKPGAHVCAAVWGAPERNAWATTIMTTIARHVDMPKPPEGAPGLFRCAAPGMMAAAFTDAGLRDIHEEDVTTVMVHDTPEAYWTFMIEIAAPVVAGLAKADDGARARIKTDVLQLASQSMRAGKVELRSTATVIAGTRA
ncbi:class I SAM-dependent methyltransferase [Ensifer sp.]|jgi:SAM-dependent methyltransferase|uniref:class I SAM-dependent methyltransferase n=1 Tax=Ensifer sp. TaxID=1872086 RepID=UPI002E11F345|nr:methyltransferase domain-containing protein [Ensifer sp.]